MRTRLMLLSLALLALTTSIARSEQIDNPQYKSWSKHQPGTKVVLQNDMSAQGMSMSQSMTQTLQQVTPEKVVIELSMTSPMGGAPIKQSTEIPAKVEKGQENLPPNMKGEVKEAGKETVEVLGKKYECTVYQFTGQSQQGNSTGKFWRTEQIPGGVAKVEMEMQGQMQATMKTMVTSVEVK